MNEYWLLLMSASSFSGELMMNDSFLDELWTINSSLNSMNEFNEWMINYSFLFEFNEWLETRFAQEIKRLKTCPLVVRW